MSRKKMYVIFFLNASNISGFSHKDKELMKQLESLVLLPPELISLEKERVCNVVVTLDKGLLYSF